MTKQQTFNINHHQLLVPVRSSTEAVLNPLFKVLCVWYKKIHSKMLL